MDISITIKVIDPKFSVYNPDILLGGILSQNFDLGPGFHFMVKNGYLLVHFLFMDFFSK